MMNPIINQMMNMMHNILNQNDMKIQNDDKIKNDISSLTIKIIPIYYGDTLKGEYLNSFNFKKR